MQEYKKLFINLDESAGINAAINSYVKSLSKLNSAALHDEMLHLVADFEHELNTDGDSKNLRLWFHIFYSLYFNELYFKPEDRSAGQALIEELENKFAQIFSLNVGRKSFILFCLKQIVDNVTRDDPQEVVNYLQKKSTIIFLEKFYLLLMSSIANNSVSLTAEDQTMLLEISSGLLSVIRNNNLLPLLGDKHSGLYVGVSNVVEEIVLNMSAEQKARNVASILNVALLTDIDNNLRLVELACGIDPRSLAKTDNIITAEQKSLITEQFTNNQYLIQVIIASNNINLQFGQYSDKLLAKLQNYGLDLNQYAPDILNALSENRMFASLVAFFKNNIRSKTKAHSQAMADTALKILFDCSMDKSPNLSLIELLIDQYGAVIPVARFTDISKLGNTLFEAALKAGNETLAIKLLEFNLVKKQQVSMLLDQAVEMGLYKTAFIMRKEGWGYHKSVDVLRAENQILNAILGIDNLSVLTHVLENIPEQMKDPITGRLIITPVNIIESGKQEMYYTMDEDNAKQTVLFDAKTVVNKINPQNKQPIAKVVVNMLEQAKITAHINQLIHEKQTSKLN